MLEPAFKLRILVSVAVDGVQRIEEIIGRSVVGKTLDQDLGTPVSIIYTIHMRREDVLSA